MSKNIYKYKIRYTNFLKKGGFNNNLINLDNEEKEAEAEEYKAEEEEYKDIEGYDNTNENQQNNNTNENQQNNNTNENQQNSVVQTIKFKNKSEWPSNINEIQWSSRNIDLIQNIVWENDIGKDINDYTFYNSFSGFYILINGVGFRPEAFTNESRPIINNLLRDNNIEYNYPN